jgi:hypothetical protein
MPISLYLTFPSRIESDRSPYVTPRGNKLLSNIETRLNVTKRPEADLGRATFNCIESGNRFPLA